jgi:hypothetical protein
MNNKLNTTVRQRSLSSDSEVLVVNRHDIWLVERPVGHLSRAAEGVITFAFCVLIFLPFIIISTSRRSRIWQVGPDGDEDAGRCAVLVLASPNSRSRSNLIASHSGSASGI